ncbi:MAG TPA: hypothetical protein VHN77_04550 [Phycisphaerales bacterium]|nr:hypothetical protein [Phycisphaerales bacterium]
MLLRSAQFRSFIAILLVVAIPLCCCNFRSLFAGNLACEGTSISEDGLVRAYMIPETDHGPSAHGCCHGKSLTKSGASDSEPTNNPSDQPRNCSCDKSGGKMLSVEKTGLELPAQVAVAALEWAQWPELRPLVPVREREQLPHAVLRPLTSLVRMHCALVV